MFASPYAFSIILLLAAVVLVCLAAASLVQAATTPGTLKGLGPAIGMILGLIAIAWFLGGSPFVYTWQRGIWGDNLGAPTDIGLELRSSQFVWDAKEGMLTVPAVKDPKSGNALVVSYDFGSHVRAEIYKDTVPTPHPIPEGTAAITAYWQNVANNTASKLVSIPRPPAVLLPPATKKVEDKGAEPKEKKEL